jgi:hypothetical protein
MHAEYRREKLFKNGYLEDREEIVFKMDCKQIGL